MHIQLLLFKMQNDVLSLHDARHVPATRSRLSAKASRRVRVEMGLTELRSCATPVVAELGEMKAKINPRYARVVDGPDPTWTPRPRHLLPLPMTQHSTELKLPPPPGVERKEWS
jgi:hypothetical protein